MKTLTSVIFKNAKRRDRLQKSGYMSKILSFLSFAIVFGTLVGIMIGASIYVTKRLDEFEQPYAFINIMLFTNFGLLFLKSIFETLNVLYFSRDLKILLRMPIKPKDLIHAKLLKMISSEYEMEIIMLAIPMIVYGIIKQVGLLYYLYIPVILVILPIIPICISAVIIAIIMRFTNFVKNKSKAMYIAIFFSWILINIVLAFLGENGFSINSFRESVITENGLAYEIANNFKLILPIMNTFLNYNNIDGFINILFYLGISVLTYIVTIYAISPIYLKGAIGTVVNGDRKTTNEKSNLSLKDFSSRTYKKAYLWKEYMVIRRSPIFFIQCIILPTVFSFAILLIAISMVGFTDAFGFDLIADITKRANKAWGAGIFLSICQVFYMINFTSIIATSKEERWAVLTKYIPIKLSRQFNMKLLIGEISNFISSLAVIIWYYVCTRNMLNTTFLFIVGLGLNFIGEKVKIFIDLRNPKIDWDNEYTMMKQNTNVMYELFYTVVISIALILLGFIFSNITAYFIIMMILVIGINLYLSKYIFDNDKKLFEKLY